VRVSHVITRLILGGAQENTLSSVLGLQQRPGFEVRLISGPTTGSEGSLESVARDAGVLTVVPELIRAVRPWTDWMAYRALTRLFRADRPDVVHTHSGKAGILGRLAAHKARVPMIIHSIHGPSFGPFQGHAANAVFSAAERHAGRVTDHFVVVADAMKRQYLAAGIGREEQYTRIFSGFNLQPFVKAVREPELGRRLGIDPGDFVVGKIARLFELKGHDDLFDAAPELIRCVPNIRFLLVGDGPWRARLEERARLTGHPGRFVFAGLVPPGEVCRYVAWMDTLVHLSSREGLPRALPQALANRKPVVAFDCDGAGEVCRTGETGFLIPRGDRHGLVKAVTALANDPTLRRRLGVAGQSWVTERFTIQRLVEDQVQLYARLAASAARRV
jgi:glycosyltransferase involved in cell wall biosynthesis